MLFTCKNFKFSDFNVEEIIFAPGNGGSRRSPAPLFSTTLQFVVFRNIKIEREKNLNIH